MIAHQPKPAVAYLRRSTDRQEQSLADQRREIERWAGENGYALIGEYVDDAISGTSAAKRPGFQQMIAEAAKREFVAVIVWNSDRFSRGDATETEHYRFLLRQSGVRVVSVTEDYLANEGVEGDVLRVVKQFQNRQFSVSLSQNTLRGQISSVLNASDPGRVPPYGYDREIVGPTGEVVHRIRFLEGGARQVINADGKVTGTYAKGQSLRKPGKECVARLVHSDAERVETVRVIFRLCVEGVGLKGIADELNRRGVMSPRGKLWQHTTVRAIILNPVYRGDLVWNRRTESKFYEVRQGRADRVKGRECSGRVKHTDKDDWIVRENAVPPIVDRAIWDKAQAAAMDRASKCSGAGKQEGRWLLSGVMRCACCGQPYWGLVKRKGRGCKGLGKEVRTGYYVCAGHSRMGKSVCPVSAHVRSAELEAWVMEQVASLVLRDGECVDDAVDRFVAAVSGRSGSPNTAAEISRLEGEIAKIDVQVSALITGLDPANLALVNGQLTRMRRQKDHAAERLRTLKASDTATDESALRRFARERIGAIRDILDGRRDEQSRRAIASYVDRIEIDPATKTGVLVLNAGVAALAANLPPQKHSDLPQGSRSQVTGIEGG
ncbi:MAG: recombinase family protein [Phycisphaeraceae bacterium]|nr:recombinase family protein [Phycisphaeraceae bacterium]